MFNLLFAITLSPVFLLLWRFLLTAVAVLKIRFTDHTYVLSRILEMVVQVVKEFH